MDEKDKREKDDHVTGEILREMTEHVTVPDSLRPESVEKKLQSAAARKRRRYRRKYWIGLAAACFCVLLGAGGYLGLRNMTGEQEMGKSTAGGEGTAGTAQIAVAEDYEEIYEYLVNGQKERENQNTGAAGAVMEDAGTMDSAAVSETGSSAGQSKAYSDTNVREDGIGEADTVKTDGDNIYIVSGRQVRIVGIDSSVMKDLGKITIDGNVSVSEVYAENGKLAVFYTRTEYEEESDGSYMNYRDYACMDVYDVSEPEAPALLGTVSQSGMYNSMREKDGYIYILSSFYVNVPQARDQVSVYIPEVQGKILDAADIFMPEADTGSSYTVISAVSLDDPGNCLDKKAIFGNTELCYVSDGNIYIIESYYGQDDADVTQTSLKKISYGEGKLEGTAQVRLDGTVRDSFGIDEYEGYLRIVATVSPVSGGGVMPIADTEDSGGTETSNNLYILDENLGLTGQITGMAEGERIYSSRFMGDTAYVVTYKEVDPLFSVDLSDPASPQIIGELKIPGFSEYLHPYGEGRLLGIGMDADEANVSTEGVKLSMFDISDPGNVEEISKYILEDTYGSEAAYNYKAVFIDVEKNLFGFPVYGDSSSYCVFTYEEGSGFAELFVKEMNVYGTVRGLYSGDTFYLVTEGTVESFTLSGFEKIDDIVL